MSISLIVVVVLLAGGFVKGFRKGFVDELNTVVCLLFSLLAIAMFIVAVRGYMEHETARTTLGAVCLVVAVLVYKIVDFILSSLKLVSSIPVVKGVNKLCGGVLGAAEAVVLIWIAHIALIAFVVGSVQEMIVADLQKSPYVLMLLDHNILATLISQFSSVLTAA